MWISQLLGKLARRPQRPVPVPAQQPVRGVDLRIDRDLFEKVRLHVEDFRRGEEAGFLICGCSRLSDRDVLLAREWIPVPDEAIERRAHGSVLAWSAAFNSDALARAMAVGGTPVLVHSHGSPAPRFSADDRMKERPLFAAFSRITEPLPTGTLLLGQGDAAGSFWIDGKNDSRFQRLVVIGETIETWPSPEFQPDPGPHRERLGRQTLAIGPKSDQALRGARVAVVGLSGGGSHVVQQLAYQGVGTLIAIDDDTVDLGNLGRLVGAIHSDVDRTKKVAVAERVALGVDPDTTFIGVSERFPTGATIAALKTADVIVACLDRFDSREAVNALARRYLIPLVDIGMSLRSASEHFAAADGQLIVSRPGRQCLRCWFLTDAILKEEKENRPPGYDRNPEAPGEPQVVSMNGVLASEACNCVLDLITGYSGGARPPDVFWQYDGRRGQLEPSPMPSRRPGCPACAEQGLGDPTPPDGGV
jgi:molybdopterin/thiamine biosynthesis adenylyltransferase